MTLGPGWIETTWKRLFGSCSTITETLSNRRKRKHERDTRESLQMHTRKPELKSDIISHQLLLIKIMGQKQSLQPTPVKTSCGLSAMNT